MTWRWIYYMKILLSDRIIKNISLMAFDPRRYLRA
jgi:hypothetical protein